MAPHRPFLGLIWDFPTGRLSHSEQLHFIALSRRNDPYDELSKVLASGEYPILPTSKSLTHSPVIEFRFGKQLSFPVTANNVSGARFTTKGATHEKNNSDHYYSRCFADDPVCYSGSRRRRTNAPMPTESTLSNQKYRHTIQPSFKISGISQGPQVAGAFYYEHTLDRFAHRSSLFAGVAGFPALAQKSPRPIPLVLYVHGLFSHCRHIQSARTWA